MPLLKRRKKPSLSNSVKIFIEEYDQNLRKLKFPSQLAAAALNYLKDPENSELYVKLRAFRQGKLTPGEITYVLAPLFGYLDQEQLRKLRKKDEFNLLYGLAVSTQDRFLRTLAEKLQAKPPTTPRLFRTLVEEAVKDVTKPNTIGYKWLSRAVIQTFPAKAGREVLKAANA